MARFRKSTHSAVLSLHSLPSRRIFCVHHATVHQFTVSLYSNHTRRTHVCLAVTCQLHFWQNDRDLLRATAVTRGWNGYQNESQHRKLTLHFWQNDRDLLRATEVTRGWNGYQNESQHRKLTLEKQILPLLQPGLEPATFLSRARRSNH